MRVLQGCVRYPPAPGGAETHVAALAEGLQQRGHDVAVHTTDLWSETPFTRRVMPSQVNGVPVTRHRARSPGGEAHYVLAPGMVSAFLAAETDIVHTHSYGYFQNSTALLRRRLRETPWVITPHFHPTWSMWGGARRLGLRRVYDATVGRETLAAADAVVCVSRHESELLLAEVGCDPAKIRVIPNGIHWETWADPPTGARFRKTFPQLGERLVLYAGRLATNKGLPDLVTAAASFPEAELLLVGQDMGPGEALDAQAAAAGITLHRLGHLDDDLYRSAFGAAELLALPSDYEAFGIVLLEAAAAGLPVVATRVGGVPEAVAEGETGLLVDYGDPEALGAAIASLLSDADAAAALGASGRERVARDFTWVSIVGRIEALYAELR